MCNTNTPEEDFEMQQMAKNNGDNLIFGDADKCEEWPCVGDEVETSDGNGVVKLLPDSKGYYVVSVDGEYYQYLIDELSKPKTPEEELRDEIIRVIHDDVYNGMYGKESFAVFADALMSKFEITKKPQQRL